MNTSKHESGEIVGRLLSGTAAAPQSVSFAPSAVFPLQPFNPSLAAEALAKEATLKRSEAFGPPAIGLKSYKIVKNNC
jgi:hypothetical protein